MPSKKYILQRLRELEGSINCLKRDVKEHYETEKHYYFDPNEPKDNELIELAERIVKYCEDKGIYSSNNIRIHNKFVSFEVKEN